MVLSPIKLIVNIATSHVSFIHVLPVAAPTCDSQATSLQQRLWALPSLVFTLPDHGETIPADHGPEEVACDWKTERQAGELGPVEGLRGMYGS